VYVLDKILKLLHPFCPFITEKIYQDMPTKTESIMTAAYPTAVEAFEFKQDAELLELVKELIVKIRNIRAEYGVIPSKRIKIKVKAKAEGIEKLAIYIEKLAGVESIEFVDSMPLESKVVTAVLPVADVSIPLGDLVDKDKEVLRLSKEIAKVTEEISRANGKLSNAGFVDKAPAALIDAERAKLAKWQQLLTELTERLQELVD
jgi:valyl-tRNA synthetase